jgi:hypothetical protein
MQLLAESEARNCVQLEQLIFLWIVVSVSKQYKNPAPAADLVQSKY